MVNSSSRPPGTTGGVTPSTKTLWAWSLLALYATTGHAQKVENVQAIPRHRPQTAADPIVASRRPEAGRSSAEIPLWQDIPLAKHRNTETDNSHLIRYQDDLAPAHKTSAVRAPLAQSTESAGLALEPSARLLRDWEAEDIILLSTVDGALHGRNRKTGKNLWTIAFPDDPMVKTTHLAQNLTDQDEILPHDDYTFVVEPSPEGQLFALFKDPRIGLVRSEKTVKKMAAEAPSFLTVNGHRLAVTSQQSSQTFTIDLSTGEVMNRFPRDASSRQANNQPRCRRRSELEVEDPACRPGRTVRLGRNRYVFTITEEENEVDIATIQFSEWVTNTNDRDLQNQYRKSLDGCEIISYFDGLIIGMDYNSGIGERPKFSHKLESPVARVFDPVRSLDDEDESTDLVLLSRPLDLPVALREAQVWRSRLKQSQRVYVNQLIDDHNVTHWYAMSDFSFPGVTKDAPRARIAREYDDVSQYRYMGPEDLVGVHLLNRDQSAAPIRLTISGSEHNDPAGSDGQKQVIPGDHTQSPMAESSSRAAPEILPPQTSVPLSTVIIVLLTWTLVIIGGVIVFLPGSRSSTVRAAVLSWIASLFLAIAPHSAKQIVVPQQSVIEQVGLPTTKTEKPATSATGVSSDEWDVVTDVRQPTDIPTITPNHSRAQSTTSTSGSPKKRSKMPELDDNESDADSDDDDFQRDPNITSPDGIKPRRKTKRGKRGGKKNKKRIMDPTTFDEKPVLAVEQPLSNGVLQVGTLKIDTREDTCLGRGSNGTTVYPATFLGREVAVKRLIKSTNDLAKKEIQHLMSSDENPHVIRFYTHEESRDFFYIALDRFTASLDQFIEHSDAFPTLISGTKGFDVKDCLQQITYGVQHLHSLKLVHRDIKPQNVLVKPVRSNRPYPEMPPLLFVISDFGLCKPLDEGAMSTFAPTANHTAAGTTGWRAPELLVGPKDCNAAPSAQSTQSVSTTHSRDGTVIDPPTGRRATKAIDIFSLGCVFYYVMTQGGHPFDKGGSSLGRDLNIKDNNLTTELLQLHRYEYDADDLILQMLKHDPKERPDCARVLRHPYFWSQEQKLDFVCLVSDCYEGEKNSINNIHDEHAVRTAAELAAFAELAALESLSPDVIGVRNDGTVRDFLTALPKSFINEMGRQRKYTGTKMIDLLRVIRNKKNHFKDLPLDIRDLMLKNADGQLAGYYQFWAERFPSLLINCHAVVLERRLVSKFGLEKWYE